MTSGIDAYSEVTQEIKVAVSPNYLPEHSDPRDNNFAFSYSVTIENQSSESVQLINRHWKVFSGTDQIADVKGEGVVGLQPVLEPENTFQYTSGTTIDTPQGSMEGIYTFLGDDGNFFDVIIPKFDLICPDVVN